MLASTLPQEEHLSSDIEEELDALELFSNEELQQATQITVPEKYSERLQVLLDKQQRDGLTTSEKETAEQLVHYHNRVMLVRAKAAALLNQRGYNVSSLLRTHL